MKPFPFLYPKIKYLKYSYNYLNIYKKINAIDRMACVKRYLD